MEGKTDKTLLGRTFSNRITKMDQNTQQRETTPTAYVQQVSRPKLLFFGPLPPFALRKDLGKLLDLRCALRINSFDFTFVFDKEMEL